MKKSEIKYTLLNSEDVRGIFDYDAGTLRWKKSGLIAGYAINTGYRAVKIRGHQYVIHKLVWLYVYGSWPSSPLDHIDCDKSNNKVENLRLADASLNGANIPVRSDNVLNLKGIQLHKATGKYRARIFIKGKHVSLGLHHKVEDAVAAYARAAKDHFGDYARVE